MRRRRVIILGTGTDVGKTYLGVGLLRAWRRQGISTLALKPVESGLVPGTAGTSGDAFALREAADSGAPPLYALRDPVSPHLAARRESRRVDLTDLGVWVARQEEDFFGPLGRGGISLIETAGGVFTPLSELQTNLDLAARLLPALLVVVAPDSLGVLHDVSATLRGMYPARAGMVVLSQGRPADASTGTNAIELQKAVFPLLGGATPLDPQVVTVRADDKADFVAERVLELCDAL